MSEPGRQHRCHLSNQLTTTTIMVTAHPHWCIRDHTAVLLTGALLTFANVHTARSYIGMEERGAERRGQMEKSQNDSLESNNIIVQSGLSAVYEWMHASINVHWWDCYQRHDRFAVNQLPNVFR